MSVPVQVDAVAPAPAIAPISPPSNLTPAAATNAAPATDAPVHGSGGPTLQMIGLAEICANRYQPRQSFDDATLSQLAESIRRSGLMQPIVIRPLADPSASDVVAGVRYELVAGERRWRAAKLAGLRVLPALVRGLGEEEAAEWALIENMQREDLNAVDRAEALKTIIDRFGVSPQDLADRLGLERPTVSNLVRITELEKEICELIRKDRLSGGHAKALLMLPPGKDRIELAQKAALLGMSVRSLEQEAKDLAAAARRDSKAAKDSGGAQSKKKDDVAAEVLEKRRAIARDVEARLRNHLATDVSIDLSKDGRSGVVMVKFFGLDQFEDLMRRMGV